MTDEQTANLIKGWGRRWVAGSASRDPRWRKLSRGCAEQRWVDAVCCFAPPGWAVAAAPVGGGWLVTYSRDGESYAASDTRPFMAHIMALNQVLATGV